MHDPAPAGGEDDIVGELLAGAHRQKPAADSAFEAELKEAGIPTAVYYPKPLHLQTAFLHLGYREGDFPRSEDAAKRIFSLPMHPYLKPTEQEKIAGVFQRIKQ